MGSAPAFWSKWRRACLVSRVNEPAGCVSCVPGERRRIGGYRSVRRGQVSGTGGWGECQRTYLWLDAAGRLSIYRCSGRSND